MRYLSNLEFLVLSSIRVMSTVYILGLPAFMAGCNSNIGKLIQYVSCSMTTFIHTISPLCRSCKFCTISFVTFFLVTPFVVQPLHAQSGVGIGTVSAIIFDGGGGFSIRYKPVQVFMAGVGNAGDGFFIHLGARYNHPLKDWKRIKLNAFGHVTRMDREMESSSIWYQFSGGVSADFRIGRKSKGKGWVLSADTGVVMNNSDGIEPSPSLALAFGIHYFFW